MTMMMVMLLLNSVVGGAVMVVGGATVVIVQTKTWLSLMHAHHAEIKKGNIFLMDANGIFNIFNG